MGDFKSENSSKVAIKLRAKESLMFSYFPFHAHLKKIPCNNLVFFFLNISCKKNTFNAKDCNQ